MNNFKTDTKGITIIAMQSANEPQEHEACGSQFQSTQLDKVHQSKMDEIANLDKEINHKLKELEGLIETIDRLNETKKKTDHDIIQFVKDKREFEIRVKRHDIQYKADVNDEVIEQIKQIKKSSEAKLEERITEINEYFDKTRQTIDEELITAKRASKLLIEEAREKASLIIKGAEQISERITHESEHAIEKREQYLEMKRSAEEAGQQLDRVRKMFISISKIMEKPEIEKARFGMTFMCYGNQKSCGFPAAYAYKVGSEWHLSACMACSSVYKDVCPHCSAKSNEKIKISYWNS